MGKQKTGIVVPGMVRSFAVKPAKTIKDPNGGEITINELQIVVTVNLNETSGSILPELYDLKDEAATIDIGPLQKKLEV